MKETESADRRDEGAPHALWAKAQTEHPADPNARRRRYLDLMIEHGHVVRIQDHLLSPSEKDDLHADLAVMARQRRRAECEAASLWMA